MSASDELAAIEARLAEDENEYAGGVVDQSVRDRRYLLALVREQQARLDELMAKQEPPVAGADALDA
jgi:benzoyl-CoA reductase/2-hydroxyglutaryl-CoA dehydratase subunit BcrC/BadD/HgdB